MTNTFANAIARSIITDAKAEIKQAAARDTLLRDTLSAMLEVRESEGNAFDTNRAFKAMGKEVRQAIRDRFTAKVNAEYARYTSREIGPAIANNAFSDPETRVMAVALRNYTVRLSESKKLFTLYAEGNPIALAFFDGTLTATAAFDTLAEESKADNPDNATDTPTDTEGTDEPGNVDNPVQGLIAMLTSVQQYGHKHGLSTAEVAKVMADFIKSLEG